jgi:hypothetical protein
MNPPKVATRSCRPVPEQEPADGLYDGELSEVSTLPESSPYSLRNFAFLSIFVAMVVIAVKISKKKAKQFNEKSEVYFKTRYLSSIDAVGYI